MQESMDLADLPPVVAVERRHQPDRRRFWRGGRRNSDWTMRPPGAWRHMERQLAPWRQWIAKLPLPGMSPVARQAPSESPR
jgi:hypothetical protein